MKTPTHVHMTSESFCRNEMRVCGYVSFLLIVLAFRLLVAPELHRQGNAMISTTSTELEASKVEQWSHPFFKASNSFLWSLKISFDIWTEVQTPLDALMCVGATVVLSWTLPTESRHPRHDVGVDAFNLFSAYVQCTSIIASSKNGCRRGRLTANSSNVAQKPQVSGDEFSVVFFQNDKVMSLFVYFRSIPPSSGFRLPHISRPVPSAHPEVSFCSSISLRPFFHRKEREEKGTKDV